jgi:hypothetical protein
MAPIPSVVWMSPAMPLILQRQEFCGGQLKVYESQRYIGRIYQTPSDDWYWSVDLLLTEGKKSIDGRAATRVEALKMLRTAWEGVKHRRPWAA